MGLTRLPLIIEVAIGLIMAAVSAYIVLTVIESLPQHLYYPLLVTALPGGDWVI